MIALISWSAWPCSPTPRKRRRALIRGATAQMSLNQSSWFRVRSALAGTSRTGGRHRTDRQQTGREPDGFVRSEDQAWNLSVDDWECRPSSVPGIDLGLFGVTPKNEQRLLPVLVLEVAVVGVGFVSVDHRRFFAADVMIRDRKQWRPSWLVHEALPRCDMIDRVARRTTKGVRIEFLKSKPRVLAFATRPTGDELTGAEDTQSNQRRLGPEHTTLRPKCCCRYALCRIDRFRKSSRSVAKPRSIQQYVARFSVIAPHTFRAAR